MPLTIFERMVPAIVWRALGLAAISSALGSTFVAAQGTMVRGRVLERGTDNPVAGATIELSGSSRTLTGPNGSFVIPGVRAGRRTLTVTMLGYQRRQLTLDVCEPRARQSAD